MKTSIVARETEIHQLDTLMEEELPQFVAVYGRRRVGKTFLVREYFNDEFAFFHTAISPRELKDRQPELLYRIQLDEFGKTLKLYGYQDDSQIKDWFDAFDRLWRLIQQHPAEERLVLFIDEMPWLDTPRAGFMSALEHFWNRYASGRHKLMLIAAGSATAWMLDNLVNNNGGLYDRTSRDIHVHPFSLSETETYFQKRNILMDRYDIAQSYMIVGGVPYYLSLFERGKSLAQNIDAVFFERGQAFEDVCFSHQEQIKRALGIQGVHTEIYPWWFISEGETPGAQIDMLIDRADRVVNVCEMKFVQGEFSIDKDYDEKLRNKIVAVTEQMGSRKNPQMTLVTTYGLKKGIYSGRFQKVVTLDDLFVF